MDTSTYDPRDYILTVLKERNKKRCFFCRATRVMVTVQINNKKCYMCKACGGVRGE